MRSILFLPLICITTLCSCRKEISRPQSGESSLWWHGKERHVHYLPDGEDFVLYRGKRRFNRALYGSGSAFRVEAGDLPEFAMYMPGMGGNFKLGIVRNDSSKWLIDADSIETRYRPGSMLYAIRDSLLGEGTVRLQLLPLADEEGFVLKSEAEDLPGEVRIFWAFGGASGKKFSRNGDIGADPESVFYLQPGYCTENEYRVSGNRFELEYGAASNRNGGTNNRKIFGIFPAGSEVRIADAEKQDTPARLFASGEGSLPLISGMSKPDPDISMFWMIRNASGAKENETPEQAFLKAEEFRRELTSRVKVQTPDPFINTLGGALAVAADGIWGGEAYQHGAVAWRMPLNGWRGAYIADPLGWHDRAGIHFGGYANSQVTRPETGPVVADTALQLARQKEVMGTSLFSSGYISRNPNNNTRPHHYDMNLVFIDQVLHHMMWTGDREFMEKMWPVLQRHLDWEKRNFDTDGDGLYDAYASIWASDALQYNGGGVTHSSAYNYRANLLAALLAEKLGKDPSEYTEEADKIYAAVNEVLWMPGPGRYAEYKDIMGNRLLHPYPGLWTVYHAMDAGIPDAFRAWQLLRYVDTELPRIPVRANGLGKDSLYLVPTTTWQPYTWSVNNVALAEVLHTALAYWQGNRPAEAFRLWESALAESMYLGASPGGFHQLSFYDAMRGELYRDFADPIGMAGRTLAEGLFGIRPDAVSGKLAIRPGFPRDWEAATLDIPDVRLDYKRRDNRDEYGIVPSFKTKMDLELVIPARGAQVGAVTVNGEEADWAAEENAVGFPSVVIRAPSAKTYDIVVEWEGSPPAEQLKGTGISGGNAITAFTGGTVNFHVPGAEISGVYDPQQVLDSPSVSENEVSAGIASEKGEKTFFVHVGQGEFRWWLPVEVSVGRAVTIIPPPDMYRENEKGNEITIHNNTGEEINGRMTVNPGKGQPAGDIHIPGHSGITVRLPPATLVPGSNTVRISLENGTEVKEKVLCWEQQASPETTWKTVDLKQYYNSRVGDIFKNEYKSPRPVSPTLQLPLHGIGNWCYPGVQVNIDDSGWRKKAGAGNRVVSPQGIPFDTPGAEGAHNVVYTSMWDNYPEAVEIPLSGKASHLYMIMAGSTNPMQSQLVNGEVVVEYDDGSRDVLQLRNPENWWPVEQDYFTDRYAFDTGAPKPPRVYFKEGKITRDFNDFITIKGFTGYGVDGGAGTLLDLSLDAEKNLRKMQVRTVANDVIVGLMSATLMQYAE
ncbi:DUF4450 domain-containing protein [Sinomicrobium soli]|uniref:DUF4450 domain-containing protein n=1 Tax=Sinomicrobium sp. N-1-3-6 TaxID=2219864 RepID=UPI000DCE09A2|nr:DUF4450 domain-containing protein [Sinomicrobium sp. N-1-3-6]RAV28135.1 glycogen debranching protein [Sinomicrobium sp. N-1-3-6]